ncbi:chorismate mutase [Streptomyces brevispora]|uniref:chorismate mutase n=1 Tax=Streptomyces brevispora TaxID=887462 RepID=UPI0035E05554
MRITTPLRHTFAVAAATAAVVFAAPPSSAADGAPASTATEQTTLPLHSIAALSAECITTADLVAAAKWGTGSPIDDPTREQQVLDAVAAQAQQLGADPDEVRQVFRDQIEANKIVQRGLYQRWTAHPDQAPTTRPDLGVVRQEINRINKELVQALADTASDRAGFFCRPELALAATQVHYDSHLDGLHTKALARSLRSVCTDNQVTRR